VSATVPRAPSGSAAALARQGGAGARWARARALVTPEQVAAYQRDGAVCLRGLLSPAEVSTLARGINANLAAPSPRAIVASRPDDPGFFIEDFCNWQDNADYRTLILQSPLAEAAALLMASRSVRLYHDHMLTKEPGTRQPTPWHQDQPYYNVDGLQNASFWIPVDPVRRHSTLEFVAGSHRGPWLMPRTFMTNEARWFPEGSLAELPDIAARRDEFDILGWALEPGDVVCFHMLALHASAGVDADRRRRVFSLRCLGDDMVHAPRRWTTSPPFPGLADELLAGAPMAHALFPLLVGEEAA
jgi:ectoine hydroxylase-related dioxygenase (phytanoyl-CoA dioxygenase family)